MKKYKILIFVYLTLALFLGLSSAIVNADGVTTYVYDGTYGYTTTSEDVYEIVNGVKHIINHGTGISDSGKTLKEDRINHIYVADVKNNDKLKIVTWAVQKDDNSGFMRNSLLDIAKDYEAKHHGWVILAGTNADQFYTGYGTGLGTNGTDYFSPQPYYPYISDGDNLFAYSPYANCNNVAGFKNDDSNVQIEYGQRSIQGLYIHIYDDNDNEIASFSVTDLNLTRELEEGETTILAPYTTDTGALCTITKSSTNGFYYIENPDLSYVSNSKEWTWKEGYNVNAFFGKGAISKIVNDNISFNGTKFAIETRNEELKSMLNVGTYVKCQYEFDSGFSNIEEACGFHTAHIVNGEVQEVANGYNTPNYPRSMFGCDNEGKVYLITTEKSTEPKDGMRGQEMNALMLQYGITYAFQCDGGGSVQSICRDEDGVLDYAQTPYEGSYRPVLTGNFIAMKVENVSLSIDDVTNTSAIINVTDVNNEFDAMAIKLSYDVNGENKEEIYDVINGCVELNNLTKITKYKVQVLVKKNGEFEETYVQDSFYTLKDFPKINNVTVKILDDGNYEIRVNIEDIDSVTQKAAIYINGKKKTIKVSNNEIVLEYDKDANGILNMYFEFDCNFSGLAKTIKIEDYNLDASAEVYISHIASYVNSFFDFE